MEVVGDRVWAVGGTYHKPTCLYSHDAGRSFVAWATPAVPGLRDAHLEGDVVWVVGEYGTIATTPASDGETWTRVKVPAAQSCLYTIVPDHRGRLLITGDAGLVLRRAGKRFVKVPTRSKARILNACTEAGCTWLLDSAGMLQRSSAKGFEEVPLAAMRAKRPLTMLARTRRGTLIVIGDGGLVLRSVNDGASWKKVPIDSRVDLEWILVTRLGIFVIGDHGSLLVSHDDGRSFQGFSSELSGHLWSIAEVGDGLLVGGEAGQIWRITRTELAAAMRDAFAGRDPQLSELAARVHEGVEGAELVLEDALLEREGTV
jgi:photosystem II stability/assembly factor-like uncharacterized protein